MALFHMIRFLSLRLFLIYNGKFIESTGSPDDKPQAKSQVGILSNKTSKLDAKISGSFYLFWEVVILNDKLYQLTYKSNGIVLQPTSKIKWNSYTEVESNYRLASNYNKRYFDTNPQNQSPP
jgi:hypothetical protein